ncbi:hypothetical protein [Acinetobacter rongchengensis]|uniref:Uncharacterized protein n=1 Tax=Acinetobacter rongchengensis TaxID=2419601 RepID=A0A3A8EVL7_9GAMM|nr:hypothetical protein [Acinetobacter rongchengensis]RKG38902.1 hypothetical protein D7V20_06425 [Acinetobacter rongchengensis]
MLILVIIIAVIALGIVFAKHVDQQRWQRYQFERDMYFRQYPFQWKGLEQFELVLNMNTHAQKKLINELMLRASETGYLRKARVQREPECVNQQYSIKVMIQDLTIGYLEKRYAELLGGNLRKTDFETGRPIELNAEIIVFEKDDIDLGCRVRLDLPRDPRTVDRYIIENNKPNKAK